MGYFIKSFLRGVLATVPLFLSVYAFIWFFGGVESFAKQIIEKAIGPEIYFTGLGVLGGVICITLVGIIMTSIVAQKLHAYLEEIIAKLPVLKTIYFAIDDFMEFFASPDAKKKANKVVLVKHPNYDMQIVGILTNDQPQSLVRGLEGEKVAVYIPMTYQIGGFTVFLPKNDVIETDLGVEEAMKLTMTGWIKKSD